MPSYYDIDAILAEEELVPCTTLWNCSFLSHLDPELDENQHYLPENSRIKIPLWVVEKWAGLGCVRLSLPRHFNRKTRERIEAEPSEVDLRYVSCKAGSLKILAASHASYLLCPENAMSVTLFPGI